jgi:hypothetical protein
LKRTIAKEEEILEYLTQLMREGESSREALRAAELIGKTYALFDKGKADGAEQELTVRMDYGDNDNSESEPGV